MDSREGLTTGRGPQTVPAALAARAADNPDQPALETSSTDRLTFADWYRRARGVAVGLWERGLHVGDPVVLSFGARHWTDFAVAYCGVQLAGGIAVPCSDRLPPAELGAIIRHCGATAVLRAADHPPPVAADQRDAAADRLPEVRPDDTAQIIYTSGTTGRPKGVAASHANLTHGFTSDPRRRPLAHSGHFLHAFPIGTNAGQTMLLSALNARPTALSLPRFTPTRFARLIERYRVGTVFVVPAMAIELLNSSVLDRYDVSSVVLLGSTAAALPPVVASGLARALPRATIVNYYTSTEAAPTQTAMIFDPYRPEAVGRAVGGTLMIADGAGRPLPPGTIGEVWLRAHHPRTYHRDPVATGRVFRGNWVRMGDLGRLDGDGYLYLVDRPEDVITTGAFKVSTLRVEAVLHEHRAVAEAAAFGLDHPVLGMVVGAAVVPRGDLRVPELRDFLLDRLADYEVPTRVVVLDRLPRNAAGKVLKRELLERVRAQ